MAAVYLYVVDRDVGFAPNPFHGYCSLATCKPGIRSTAQIGDWVIGMGGKRLNATGKCIFAMQVTAKVTFQEYWTNRMFVDKKPIRNGSSTRLVGDNIYHRHRETGTWLQVDSNHSNDDGSPNQTNVNKDTKSDKVLLSENFFYFGSVAPLIPVELLRATGFENRQGHRRFTSGTSTALVNWIRTTYRQSRNRVISDPYDFFQSQKRYPGKGSKLI